VIAMSREPAKGIDLEAHQFISGKHRVLVEHVRPELDGGRYPVKRVLGDRLVVEADMIADGHDILRGALLFRQAGESAFRETPLEPLVNDRYRASFELVALGRFQYSVEGWVDSFGTWQRALTRRLEARQDVSVEILVGAALVLNAAGRATSGPSDSDAKELHAAAQKLREPGTPLDVRIQLASSAELRERVARHPDRAIASRYPRVLEVIVDRPRARFSSWYEFFPRSTKQGQHGTFRDAEARLDYVAEMGFDVVYLPPIHPIGKSNRKGRNNSVTAEPGEPGSPWAIGGDEGGHKAIHPELGTLADFKRFVERARDLGMEIALDVAFQTSPDHPYVKEHPEWFNTRPDGTIQYAENPPKKYQDVYPFNFDSADWPALWQELKSIFSFWIEQGVRIFRVDNPHTKPLAFWDFCITELKAAHPDVIFLAEAFTRPKLMYALAKLGFSQSYTYFTWRTSRAELVEYASHLFYTEVADFFRPNFWPNTPDILPEHLQHGGRGAFISRVVLAATLSSNYGIYGPAFELMEHVVRPGSEDYFNSEKFEIKHWNIERPDSLRHLLTRLNSIRRENAALQDNKNLRFHPTTNDLILCYSKATDDLGNIVLVVVNLDYYHRHSAWVDLDLRALGVSADENLQVHDLLTDVRYPWRGGRNYVELDPAALPAHIFRLRRFVRRENQFEYYL
jgi:starch synthase (maltosyl-transferring)